MADFDEQKERETFVAWFASGRRAEPDFNNIVTQFMLEAWEARARHQPSAPALPVEAIVCAADRLVGIRNELEKIKHLDASIPEQIAAYQRHIDSLRALLPPAEQ